jgi:hypothetical protein
VEPGLAFVKGKAKFNFRRRTGRPLRRTGPAAAVSPAALRAVR